MSRHNLFAAALAALSLSAIGCDHSKCAPGDIPNDFLQGCVPPKECPPPTVLDEHTWECTLQCADGTLLTNDHQCEDVMVDGGTGTLTSNMTGDAGAAPVAGRSPRDPSAGASGRNDRDAGTDSGNGGAGGVGGSSPAAGAGGAAGGAGTPAAPSKPVCGDGVRDGAELCDGSDCPTKCGAPTSACLPLMLQGAAKTCDAQCVPVEITMCSNGDGCCPMGCTYANDKDCSQTCGDGVVSGVEKCEPGSTDHPCPTARDCDDGNVCTEDRVTGAGCSAECTHTTMMRAAMSCDDGNPCTDDTMIESKTACSYECTHSTPKTPTGSCVDTDPCTDDTPVMSKTTCAYECPHHKQQPKAASCDDGNPCTDDKQMLSKTSCAYECAQTPAAAGTSCGDGRSCTADGMCTAPPGCAQASAANLLKNPGFASNLDGWTVAAGAGTITWVNGDANACSISGAAQFSVSNGVSRRIEQCVPASGGRAYYLAAQIKGSGNGETTTCQVDTYNLSGCIGNSSTQAQIQWLNVAWGPAATTPVMTDSAVVSARISCSVDATGVSGAGSQIDSIYFGRDDTRF
jgi:hypothetical protein